MFKEFIPLVTDWAVRIGGALLVFVIGRWVAQIIARLVEKALQKTETDETLTRFLKSLTYFGILILVIIAALGTLGVNTTSFAAVIGAIGLAAGLAFQNSLSNFSSAILILFLRPFKVGDVVEAGGVTGKVEEINLVNTVVKTPDNVKIFIPNSNITSSHIKNFSAEPIRRIDLVIGIGYDDDLKKAKKLLEEILKNHPKVLKEPAPSVAVVELADSSVNIAVRPWVKGEDYWSVRSELIETIKETFDREGISIPYPQMDVHADVKLKKE